MWVEKHGKTWRVRDERGGKKVTLQSGYPTKTAAKDGMATLRADQLRGTSLVPRGDRVTVDGWLDAWWPAYESGLKPSARVSAVGIVSRYIRPMLGFQTLGDLVESPLIIQRWTADLLRGEPAGRVPRRGTVVPLAAKTIYNAHGLLHRILDGAVQSRLISSNPCEHTNLPSKNHHEMRFLTEPEAERLVAATPVKWQPLVLFILGTGVRWGEAIGLRVKDVDVLARRCVILRQTQELADTAEIVDEEPKSLASRRSVTFTTAVADALVPLVAHRAGEARVFTAPMGGVVRTRRFYEVWTALRAAAGLDGLRVHDLRHTHAAWLISHGAVLTAVQRRLGHKSITVTSDLYGHLLPVADEQILSILEEALPKISIGGTVGGTGVEPDALRAIPIRSSAGQAA